MANEDLMTTDEVAAHLRIPVQTLYTWRGKGYGPRALKIGKHLRWRPQDVEAWLEEHVDNRYPAA